MASSSGNSNSSGSMVPSGSEEDQHQLLDQRKRKRMESNRESARRSRMRKQKRLDDLMSQVTDLAKENNQILTSITFTTQHYLNMEAENSVLRAQTMELSQRLESLSEILHYLNNGGRGYDYETEGFETSDESLNLPHLNQPIMASADMMFGY
ncbi:basic leucine-zipper 44 [Hibiscus trionum]|uniref:Basic leucine-zipper 44 n=1 Tax=Hibiscus trionum TaxID=183268 RepID=A0A9W7JMH2_HIBTR|nr:basic leucine-zipper 44 [Hibiscus trionum]